MALALNPECVRDTLLTIYEEDLGNGWVFYKDSVLLSKYSAKEVMHHLRLFTMTNIVQDTEIVMRQYADVQGGLSDEGKQFAENIANDEVWARLMERFYALPSL